MYNTLLNLSLRSTVADIPNIFGVIVRNNVLENCSLPMRCTSSTIVKPKLSNAFSGKALSYNVCNIPKTISFPAISNTGP